MSGCFGEAEDEDGLEPDVEKEGYTVTVTLLDRSTRSFEVDSSPYIADEDGDGLDDQQERLERTDPRNPDTDGDGLLDGHDIELDSDDGRVKQWRDFGIRERAGDGPIMFLGERGDERVATGGDPLDQDSDEDGITDGDEVGGFEVVINGRARTVQTRAQAPDSDSDGLLDGFERTYGTDPSERDTDGDGVPDRSDINPWRDAKVQVDIIELTMTSSPSGAPQAEVFLIVQDSGKHTSPIVTLQRGAAYNGSAFDVTIDVSDEGGDALIGRHNTTLVVTFLVEGGSAGPKLLDLFSTTTGGTSLFAEVNAMTGALAWTTSSGRSPTPWPADDIFAGAHGNLTLTFAPTD